MLSGRNNEMKHKKILLTGASGTLGSHILSSGCLRHTKVLAPGHEVMDITDKESVDGFFWKNDFDAVIHCAAMARMKECEKNPQQSIITNIIGTANLVMAAMEKERMAGVKIRFVHISTDGVYEGTKGNYSESDAARPYNRYGWTKLGAEAAVNLLSDFCIIRTGFFDPENIRFDDAPTDAFSSRIPVNELAKAIATMLENRFVGTINIGGERKSEYERLKKYKPTIKPAKLSEVMSGLPFRLARDASMDTTMWKRIERAGK